MAAEAAMIDLAEEAADRRPERRARDDAALWRAELAAAAVDGRLDGAAHWRASGVSIDTRTLEPGDLFVALAGAKSDGHAHVAAALASGAAAALVTHRPDGVDESAPLLVVENTLTALTALGHAARARAAGLRAVAVTGSVGKTSTKSMLATMLSAQAPTHAAVKSYNNHIGVPLTLARTPVDARFGVYEVGMNAPGEIAPLSRLAAPDVAVITAIAPVHVAAFEDGLLGVAREKASIVEGLRPAGVAVLDPNAPHYEMLEAAARNVGAEIIEFGPTGRHATLGEVRVTGGVTTVSARLFGQEALFKIGAPGRHLASNALAALAAVSALGGDVARAALALAEWRALDGRGHRVALMASGGEMLLVDESYNASPVAVAAAIETFADLEPGRAPSGSEGRRVAFFTDMLELGADAERLHAGLATYSGIDAIDAVHTAGPLMAALHAALPAERRGRHFDDAEAMAAAAPGLVGAGDAALVKGSLGSRASAVARALGTAYPPVEADEETDSAPGPALDAG